MTRQKLTNVLSIGSLLCPLTCFPPITGLQQRLTSCLQTAGRFCRRCRRRKKLSGTHGTRLSPTSLPGAALISMRRPIYWAGKLAVSKGTVSRARPVLNLRKTNCAPAGCKHMAAACSTGHRLKPPSKLLFAALLHCKSWRSSSSLWVIPQKWVLRWYCRLDRVLQKAQALFCAQRSPAWPMMRCAASHMTLTNWWSSWKAWLTATLYKRR